MGTTTFTGAIRSESTFKTVSKNSTSGAITEVITVGDGPVSLADSNVTLGLFMQVARLMVLMQSSLPPATLIFTLVVLHF